MSAVLFDTSVLVSYCVASHPHRARALDVIAKSMQSGIECCIALHSLAETFAVLSALPLKPRLSADQVLLLILIAARFAGELSDQISLGNWLTSGHYQIHLNFIAAPLWICWLRREG
jgi:predicted nucleic acid-binding protein